MLDMGNEHRFQPISTKYLIDNARRQRNTSVKLITVGANYLQQIAFTREVLAEYLMSLHVQEFMINSYPYAIRIYQS